MSGHPVERSVLWTVLGILFFFAFALVITLFAPTYIDPSWTTPSSDYQRQMYEVVDPMLYFGSSREARAEMQSLYHLRRGEVLLAFQESDGISIKAPAELERYVTRRGERLKLTSRLLLLRLLPSREGETATPFASHLELFEPTGEEAFALASSEAGSQSWTSGDFDLLDALPSWVKEGEGVVYIKNPLPYRWGRDPLKEQLWYYDPEGQEIASIQDLTAPPLNFRSRQSLIESGEHRYAIEGCWYCHTDQTRTLVQDLVLNGSDSEPAPPSSPNEYIYQKITFPGTKRNGPDLSRVGIKRPSRDWHRAHFWNPRTASPGSIMPSFQHLFDYDPRGSRLVGNPLPNEAFEELFQYLMTKGSRITPPDQAWWEQKDSALKSLIEGGARSSK